MSEQLTLALREYDLPPEWDGRPITWDAEWIDGYRPLICPPPKDHRTCDECDTTRTPLIKHGVFYRRAVWRTRYNQIRTGRTGLRLIALRCPDCRADTVMCHEGKVWALGTEDYGPRGSYMQEATDE